MKRLIAKGLAFALCFLLLAAAAPTLAAQEGYLQEWAPTAYADAALNKQKFCSIRTEYPVYKTGTERIMLMITNNNKKELLYGQAYVVEKQTPEGWLTQEIKSTEPGVVIVWKSDGYGVPAKATVSQQLNLYFPLQPGTYRIVKQVGYEKPYEMHAFSTIFTVADGGYDSAYLSGYAPLETLRPDYTAEQAQKDGLFYTGKNGKAYNAEKLLTFLEKVQQGAPAKLRLWESAANGQLTVTDITFLGERGLFLAEERVFQAAPGQSASAKPGISRRYYPYLNTQKVNGKTRLQLSDWVKTPIKQARTLCILPNIAAAGKSKVSELLENAYGLKPEADYRVYQDDRIYVSYERPQGEHTLVYFDSPYSSKDVRIEEPRGVLKELLYMEWSAENTVRMVFATKDKGQCEIAFDVAAQKISDVQYQ